MRQGSPSLRCTIISGARKGFWKIFLSTRCQELEEELKTAAEGGKDLPSVLYQIARGYFDFACRNREFFFYAGAVLFGQGK